MINKTKFVILEFHDFNDDNIGKVSTLEDGNIFYNRKEAEYEMEHIIAEELNDLQKIATSSCGDSAEFTRDKNTIYINGDLFRRYYVVQLD